MGEEITGTGLDLVLAGTSGILAAPHGHGSLRPTWGRSRRTVSGWRGHHCRPTPPDARSPPRRSRRLALGLLGVVGFAAAPAIRSSAACLSTGPLVGALDVDAEQLSHVAWARESPKISKPIRLYSSWFLMPLALQADALAQRVLFLSDDPMLIDLLELKERA